MVIAASLAMHMQVPLLASQRAETLERNCDKGERPLEAAVRARGAIAITTLALCDAIAEF